MIESEMKKPPVFRRVILKVEIARLKSLAKKHYEAYRDTGSDYDCGLEMARQLRPSISRHAVQYNNTMEKLEELDPDCPDWKALR